jgi:hypothetical protein
MPSPLPRDELAFNFHPGDEGVDDDLEPVLLRREHLFVTLPRKRGSGASGETCAPGFPLSRE